MGAILIVLAALSCPARALPAGRWSFPRPAIPSGGAAPRPLDRRYSLWDGQTAPLAFGQDEAREFAPAAPASAPAPQAASSPSRPGELFISVELGRDRDQLKDAVAGLSAAAGFRPDARFPPVEAGHAAGLTVFGWLPGARLGEASRLPAVRRIEIEREARRPASGAGTQIRVLVGVRRPWGLSQARDDADFAQTMRDLADDADFRWERTAGYQSIPGSRDAVILVVGSLPARWIGRLLDHPRVVKIQPFPGQDPGPASGVARRIDTVGRFFSYVAVQSPLLLAVTGVLLLPPFRPRLRRLKDRRRV